MSPEPMKRALVIVLDSVGIGHAPDAAEFGDEGADTVGHIREAVTRFAVPTLDAAGLPACEALAAGRPEPHSADAGPPRLSWGCLTERSPGKDTTIGHWELAGAAPTRPFATFERFPDTLVEELEAAAGATFLGNYRQSGTLILDELGQEHLETGKPILYTSTDSVIQIAAHEDVLPPGELHGMCRRCREVADRWDVGRVIARPFAGEPGLFIRTGNRRDISMTPPPTVLNRLSENGVETVGVGKIGDIFAGSGLEADHHTANNEEGCDLIDRLLAETLDRPQLIVANLVDFDSLFGHRRDPEGYADALEAFDAWLAGLLPRLDPSLLLVITADHGNDPTWRGTDHTRERVPLLVNEPLSPRSLGLRDTYADVAASLAEWFGVPSQGLGGTSFLAP